MRPKFMPQSLEVTVIDYVIFVARSVRWVHHIESFFIALSLPIFMSAVIFGLRLDSCVHEWANFLKHYDVAEPAARRPIEILVLIIYIIALAIVVIARRPKKRAA